MKKLTKTQKGVIVRAATAIAGIDEKYKIEKEFAEEVFVETCEAVLRKALPLRTKFKKLAHKKCIYYPRKDAATYIVVGYRVPNKFIGLASVDPLKFLRRHGALRCKKVDKLGRPNGYEDVIWLNYFEECCEIVS